METIGKITVFLIAFVFAISTFFLGAYVILSIAKMYDLKFISSFSFAQIVGILTIIQLIKYKYVVKTEDGKTFSETIARSTKALITMALLYLSAWGLSYLYLIILK